jgi:hypothetical protein
MDIGVLETAIKKPGLTPGFYFIERLTYFILKARSPGK